MKVISLDHIITSLDVVRFVDLTERQWYANPGTTAIVAACIVGILSFLGIYYSNYKQNKNLKLQLEASQEQLKLQIKSSEERTRLQIEAQEMYYKREQEGQEQQKRLQIRQELVEILSLLLDKVGRSETLLHRYIVYITGPGPHTQDFSRFLSDAEDNYQKCLGLYEELRKTHSRYRIFLSDDQILERISIPWHNLVVHHNLYVRKDENFAITEEIKKNPSMLIHTIPGIIADIASGKIVIKYPLKELEST